LISSNEKLFAQLMIEAQKGDSSSYETLLKEVSLFLKRYLRQKISDSEQLEDVVQETLLAVHKSRHTYNSDRSFISWLLAIAHYKVNDLLRISYKFKPTELDESIVDESDSQLDELLKKEKTEQVMKAVESLPAKNQMVLKLLKIEGLKISEVARLCNLSESNVKVISFRAVQDLKASLGGLF
jgi:RNA polymerase sigma-70 factor, ECF subfamily